MLKFKAFESTPKHFFFVYSSKQGITYRMCKDSDSECIFKKCFKWIKHTQKQTREKQSTPQTSYLFEIAHPYFEPIECTGMRVRAIHPHYHDNTDCVTLSCELWDRFSGAELCLLIWPQLSVSVFLLDVSFSTYSFTEYVCVCVFMWVEGGERGGVNHTDVCVVNI